MNKNEAKTAWTVAGVLAILLVIVLFLWLTAKKDLATVLENGRQDIAAQRDRIAADCQGAAANSVKCNADLTELSAILSEFSRDLKNATTTPQ